MNSNFKVEYFSPPDACDIFADVWINGLYVMQVKSDSESGNMTINFFNEIIGNDVLKEDLNIIDFLQTILAVTRDLNPSAAEKIFATITES